MANPIQRSKWFNWGWRGPKATPYAATSMTKAPKSKSKHTTPKS